MFYPATKLIVVTEAFLQEDVCAEIENGGAKGYTLVNAGGIGMHHHLHPTSDQATVAEEFSNVKIEAICADRAMAENIAEQLLTNCFKEYPGVVYLENVDIMRPDRF
jgi:nitrogen regulatory protein PII